MIHYVCPTLNSKCAPPLPQSSLGLSLFAQPSTLNLPANLEVRTDETPRLLGITARQESWVPFCCVTNRKSRPRFDFAFPIGSGAKSAIDGTAGFLEIVIDPDTTDSPLVRMKPRFVFQTCTSCDKISQVQKFQVLTTTPIDLIQD